MKSVSITFKSGAKVTFKTREFTVAKNSFGELTEVKWDSKGLSEYPLRINLDNIDAILIKETEDEQ